VRPGDVVRAGAALGRVGRTGTAAQAGHGRHLHIAYEEPGRHCGAQGVLVARNPYEWLRAARRRERQSLRRQEPVRKRGHGRSSVRARAALLFLGLALPARQQHPTGPYMGQTPPGRRPEVFAPGIVSTGDPGVAHGNIAISPDGREIVWSLFHESDRTSRTWWSRQENGRWTAPSRPPFASGGNAASLSFAPNGGRLFFTSNRRWPAGRGVWPGPRALEAQRIWYVDRTGAQWSEPRMLDLRPDRGPLAVSPAASGALYAPGILRIPAAGGGYGTPQRLPPPLRGKGHYGGDHPFVAPDESYIVFNGVWPAHRGYGIFVSYRLSGGWSDPVNICEVLGMERGGSEPMVSPDGRFLFFYADHSIYWVDAAVIEESRPAARSPGLRRR